MLAEEPKKKEEPKAEPVKFVYYIDNHQAGVGLRGGWRRDLC